MDSITIILGFPKTMHAYGPALVSGLVTVYHIPSSCLWLQAHVQLLIATTNGKSGQPGLRCGLESPGKTSLHGYTCILKTTAQFVEKYQVWKWT